jgi:prepilin-type N-terminal cleavage/methylation domain-containing protein
MMICCPNRERGFSLHEVLTTLLITGVLLTVALPAWQAYGFRIERAAALTELQQAALCQAKRSVWAPVTRNVPDPTCLPRTSSAYRYLAVPTVEPGEAGYEWRAEPLGRQRADKCGTLVLDHRGRRSVLGTAEQALRCWQGRQGH